MRTFLGVDLSGPSNLENTAWVGFQEEGDHLVLLDTSRSGGDGEILAAAERLLKRGPLVVALDAPLSYQPGGGLREGDRRLRSRLAEIGLNVSTVMPPTMTRMAYLTLRGISVARMLEGLKIGSLEICEVHPGASMSLRGVPRDAVNTFKHNFDARNTLLTWFGRQGLGGLSHDIDPGDHFLAACACALAAWRWSQKKSVFFFPEKPPFHPYPYVC